MSGIEVLAAAAASTLVLLLIVKRALRALKTQEALIRAADDAAKERETAMFAMVHNRLQEALDTNREATNALARLSGHENEVTWLREQVQALTTKLMAIADARAAVKLEDQRLEAAGVKKPDEVPTGRVGGRWMDPALTTARDAQQGQEIKLRQTVPRS